MWCAAERVELDDFKKILQDLGGSPEGLDERKELIHEIRKLQGGTEELFLHSMSKDYMKCTNHDLAVTYLKLNEDLFIRQCSTQKVYMYNMKTKLWEEPKNLKGHFLMCMNAYMEILDRGSINKHFFTCTDDEYKSMKLKYKNYIKQDSTINSILSVFKSIVREIDTQFDLSPKWNHWISFNNGLYNMKTKEFFERDINCDMTQCLDFDYNDAYCSECYQEIDSFFQKIQPNQEQKDFTVSFLKYCLTGGNPECIFKMNIGYSASNGKSSEMQIHQMVFGMYTYQLNKETFKKNCTKIHKYMSKLVTSPVRLAYINELDDTKLDEDFLKHVVDGRKLELEKLYSTMTEESTIQCKIITTSNKDPNLNVDPGVLRRMTVQQYDSQFVKEAYVDPENHKYLDDKTWTDDRFTKETYKLAYFHYLLSAPDLVVPEVNRNMVKAIVEENDEVYSTLTEHFEVTGDVNDKVAQAHVVQVFPDIPKQKLNRELKRFGIVYDKNLQVNNIRKVYKGLKCIEAEETLD